MCWEKLERLDAWKGRVAEDVHEEPKVHEVRSEPEEELEEKREREKVLETV